MYSSRTTDDCRYCGTSAAVCQTRNLTGEPGRCCRRCRLTVRSHRERTVRREQPEPPPPPPVTSVRPHPLDADDEDDLVFGILRRAEAEDDAGGAPEMFDQPSIAAYRSLAQSRGVDLAVVVRHAVRGELAAVVRRPPITTDHKPDQAPAESDSNDDEGVPR